MGTVLATSVNIPQNENRLYESSQSVNAIEALERSRARLNERSDSELAFVLPFLLFVCADFDSGFLFGDFPIEIFSKFHHRLRPFSNSAPEKRIIPISAFVGRNNSLSICDAQLVFFFLFCTLCCLFLFLLFCLFSATTHSIPPPFFQRLFAALYSSYWRKNGVGNGDQWLFLLRGGVLVEHTCSWRPH